MLLWVVPSNLLGIHPQPHEAQFLMPPLFTLNTAMLGIGMACGVILL